MLPDRVSNPGPLTYESGALPIALRGPAFDIVKFPLNLLLEEYFLFIFDLDTLFNLLLFYSYNLRKNDKHLKLIVRSWHTWYDRSHFNQSAKFLLKCC